VTAFFFRNDYYPTEEEYVFAIATRCAMSTRRIVNAGVMLQVDCPDLRWAAHTVQGSRPRRLPQGDGAEHRGAQTARIVNIPADKVRNASVLGQLSRTAPLRRALPEHCRSGVDGPSRTRSSSRRPIRAMRTNGPVRDGEAPRRGKVLIPG
jgi:hypothetical protein